MYKNRGKKLKSNNKYEVIDVKQGGMGEVYICNDKSNNKIVALKSYRSDLDSDQIRDLFIREAQAWIKIGKGEFILSPDGIEQIDGKPYIKLPYCKQGSLKELLDRGRLSREESITLLTQIALGMYRISDVDGLVHQDLKPENILLDDANRPLIADLGIVKAICKGVFDKNTIMSIDGTNAGMGTLPYMSPEQLHGEETDARSDIYAVGLIFYEMLSGQQAMTGRTHDELYSNIYEGMHSKLSPIQKKYGSEVSDIIKNCTQLSIEKRPKNFRELIILIDNLVDPDPYGKKLSWYKSDNRIKITDQKTVTGWSLLFPERTPKKESTINVKYSEPRLFAQMVELRKLGNYSESIKVGWTLLGDVNAPESNINKLLSTFETSTTEYKALEVTETTGRLDISGGIGLYFEALEQILAAYVDVIESEETTDGISKWTKESSLIVNKLLLCKFTPLRTLLLCGQLKIKSNELDAAKNTLSIVARDADGSLKHRAYGSLVVLLKDTKDFEALVDLVKDKIVPELIDDESYLAQRVCGVALVAIRQFPLAAECFLSAYQLGNNDLWSLMQAGVAKLNAGEIDAADKICGTLYDIAPDSFFYKKLHEVLR